MANVTSERDVEELRRKLAELQGQLDDAHAQNAESAARAAFFSAANTEIPTGRFVEVEYCTNPWVKREDDQVWEKKKVSTYLFKVDMPPVGGVQIMINGEALQHGQTYEVTLDRLRCLKEVVYRLQAHEAAIHGSDEDVFRPRVSKEINLRSGTIRNLPVNWAPGASAR